MDTATADAPVLDASLPDFAPERRREGLEYAALVCRRGHRHFHLSGWTRIATTGGSFFWRSVTRVFREARVAMDEGEPTESPFWLPVFATCDECGIETSLEGSGEPKSHLADERRDEPRESYRCRVCRRGSVFVAVGRASDPIDPDRADLEVVVCCRACRRQHRVAWAHDRPSDQELRLDALYGRR